LFQKKTTYYNGGLNIVLAGFIKRRQFDLKRRLIKPIKSLNYGQLEIFFYFKSIIVLRSSSNLF